MYIFLTNSHENDKEWIEDIYKGHYKFSSEVLLSIHMVLLQQGLFYSFCLTCLLIRDLLNTLIHSTKDENKQQINGIP